jgi:hypothetical protein
MKNPVPHSTTESFNDYTATEAAMPNEQSSIPYGDICVVSVDKAVQFMPFATSHQEMMHHFCDAYTFDWNVAAILLTVHEVGPNHFHGGGPVLIANIPLFFTPFLPQLVGMQPEIANIELEHGEESTFVMWTVHDNDGRSHTISINAEVLPFLMSQSPSPDHEQLLYGRVMFCCSENNMVGSVGFGGFWLKPNELAEFESLGDLYNGAGKLGAGLALSEARAFGPLADAPYNVDMPLVAGDGDTLTALPVF